MRLWKAQTTKHIGDMKKELTIEHLAAYLPYGVRFQIPKHRLKYGQQDALPMNGLSIDSYKNPNIEFLLPDDDLLFSNQLKWCKPLLRPLSQINEVIEHNGERFVPSKRIDDMGYRFRYFVCVSIGIHALPYWVVRLMLSWHFDVFGLIEAGLAEPIPSIPQP